VPWRQEGGKSHPCWRRCHTPPVWVVMEPMDTEEGTDVISVVDKLEGTSVAPPHLADGVDPTVAPCDQGENGCRRQGVSPTSVCDDRREQPRGIFDEMPPSFVGSESMDERAPAVTPIERDSNRDSQRQCISIRAPPSERRLSP